MAGPTSIEWAQAVWNPVTGCDRISPGCANCYARTMAKRLKAMGNPRYQRDGDGPGFGVTLHPDLLDVPLRWRKPRVVFVNSMSDLFHEEVPDDFIARVFSTMRCAPQHTFQVLTKRPERARDLLLRWKEQHEWLIASMANERRPRPWQTEGITRGEYVADVIEKQTARGEVIPSPNVWLGVSIENARHTWRADILREIPAAVRFISAEPLLGSLYDGSHNGEAATEGARRSRAGSRERGSQPGLPPQGVGGDGAALAEPDRRRARSHRRAPLDLTGIDWLIAGGESGPGARPMHPDWARELRDACLYPRGCGHHRSTPPHSFVGGCPVCDATRGPRFFFKQWGEHLPRGQRAPGLNAFGGDEYHRVGKKRAGRLLDGRTWDEMPTVRT